jgi:hypothetical protein
LGTPSLPFKYDFEVFPTGTPRFVAGIYPLLGFDSPLEFQTGSIYLNNNMLCAHNTFSQDTSLGIHFPFSILLSKNLSIRGWDLHAHHEHLQGLFTLLAFLALRSPKPCFMPVMLMGFHSRSFVPVSKLKYPFGYSLLLCSFLSRKLIQILPENPDSPRNRCFEAFILETSSALKRRLLSFP